MGNKTRKTARTARERELSVKAAALFKQGESYGKIAKALGLRDKKEASKLVHIGLEHTPQLTKKIIEEVPA